MAEAMACGRQQAALVEEVGSERCCSFVGGRVGMCAKALGAKPHPPRCSSVFLERTHLLTVMHCCCLTSSRMECSPRSLPTCVVTTTRVQVVCLNVSAFLTFLVFK